MELGKRLKSLRETGNINRQILAREIGISYSSLAKYENGERTPDLTILVKIADYFNTSVDFLLGREEYDRLLLYNTCLESLQKINQNDALYKLIKEAERLKSESIEKIVEVMKLI
ncbi:helix-turn-helix domain-containing protein [Natranaerobius trueperi]|nr:helix-turn-helix transcriptional regulator [Natranaerobius trueperi]